MINKKGQGMSISTIVLLVLGLIILVVLVLGFILGWDKIVPWIGGGTNLNNIATACTTACSTNSVYDYCSVMREVKDGENDKFEANCNDLATKPQYVSRGYGISPCPAITCP